jgi:nitrogen fixation/metabolism regulation signal transduction histidine kinase
VTVVVVGCWIGFAAALRERASRALQTIANLVGALREGDFSVRARGASAFDDLGLAFLELNALGETLRRQRLGALEASALLERVMGEIDVAVFALDEGGALRLVNRAGARLLGRRSEQLLARTAAELGLSAFLGAQPGEVREAAFGGRTGRFGVRRGTFRLEGKPHTLLVVADLSRALRDEERLAWQRLLRVLGHEINNSLAPIRSVAQSLRARVDPAAAAPEMVEGLDLIASRAEALARFMAAYARLARLPAPRRAPMDVAGWVERCAALERRVPVRVTAGPSACVEADADQLDQALINVVTNAADAVLEAGGGAVEAGWAVADDAVEVTVRDEGPGLPPSANVFVPFFTTKPGGSGIGLVLARQIAEAHQGTLTLENRPDRPGAVARLRLPLPARPAPSA